MKIEIVRNTQGDVRLLLHDFSIEERELLDQCDTLEVIKESRDGSTGRLEELAFGIVNQNVDPMADRSWQPYDESDD